MLGHLWGGGITVARAGLLPRGGVPRWGQQDTATRGQCLEAPPFSQPLLCLGFQDNFLSAPTQKSPGRGPSWNGFNIHGEMHLLSAGLHPKLMVRFCILSSKGAMLASWGVISLVSSPEYWAMRPVNQVQVPALPQSCSVTLDKSLPLA